MTAPPSAFVVGTGRCGSTLLSRMLACCPEIVSVSELFAWCSDMGGLSAQDLFPERACDGAGFWRMLTRRGARTTLLLQHGCRIPEILYPLDDPAHRDGVPAILLTTLPGLSDEPDRVFDELASVVRRLPTAPARDHYVRLFEWLCVRFGGKLWVERSGGGLHLVNQLRHGFPEAKFVHLVRDGREAAMSMLSHPSFRMLVIAKLLEKHLGVDPYYCPDRSRIARLPRPLRALLPERFDANAFANFPLPIALMGNLWSNQIVTGLEVLDTLAPAKVLTVHFERLKDQPLETLGRIADFLGPDLADERWMRAAASLVQASRSDPPTLTSGQRKALDEACRPGFEALGARGMLAVAS